MTLKIPDGRQQGNVDHQSKSTQYVALVTRFFHRTIHMIRSHALKKHSIHVIILASTTRTTTWQYIVLHQLFSNFFTDVNRWIIKTCILVNNLLRRFTNYQTFLIFLFQISISCLVGLVPCHRVLARQEREGNILSSPRAMYCGPSLIFVVWLGLGKIGWRSPLGGAFFL